MMWKSVLSQGARTGAVLSATTALVIGLCGSRENGAPWSGINAVTHIVDGDEKVQPQEWSPRESFLGLSINSTAMMVWGLLYQGGLARFNRRSTFGFGAACAIGAYLLDYHLVPPRLAPGIEKALSKKAVFLTYLTMALTLGLSSLWNERSPC